MMTCAVATSFLGCLVTLYLYFRFIWIMGLSWAANSFLLALFILIGCFPLLVGYKFENILGSFFPYYRYGLYFVFISCVILLTVTLFTDAFWYLGRKIGIIDFLPFSRDICLKYNLALVVIAFLLSVSALWSGVKVPRVKTLTLESPKISRETTIVLLSDLHIHRVINPQKIAQIISRANAQKPDIVLLAGDIIDDDVKRVSHITTLLNDLQASEGIFFVTGNHEFYAGYRETVDELKKLGFTFLENRGASAGNIYLAGIPDVFAGAAFHRTANIQKAFSGADAATFRLLISHTPVDFGHENIFDLEVSGHTHGGQIFPFHILTAWHNRYLAGLYDLDNRAQIYVSRGAGQWGPQMRFLAPAEITVIKLRPADR